MSTLRAHVFRALYNMHAKIIAVIFIFVTTISVRYSYK
ncbi:putative membrane protein [Bacteroides fragilis str. 2-F-2 |uniref:Putative membrane protein n=1 Tax=Bacteroides fragilis str. 2-F-2 \|nr:putative membrane protein [Bacteroides fragilis str. 2-F-2 \